MTEDPLAHSRNELAAARLLADAGFPAQAVSRAYYAAFRAAETALFALGETRSKHAGVISAFMRRLIKEHGLASDTGDILRALFEHRNHADYGETEVPASEASRAIEEAQRFVDAIAGWLQTRGSA